MLWYVGNGNVLVVPHLPGEVFSRYLAVALANGSFAGGPQIQPLLAHRAQPLPGS
jgi:hypothetical protein